MKLMRLDQISASARPFNNKNRNEQVKKMDTGITLNPERRAAMIKSGAWNDKIITDYFDQAVASTPDREAIVGYQVTSDTRNALTYRELNDKVTRMAAGLAAMGIGKAPLYAQAWRSQTAGDSKGLPGL